jgi:chromosomal replication initiator protein
MDRIRIHSYREECRSAAEIIQQFADLHGLPVEKVIGPSRTKDVLLCRQQAIAAVIVQKPNLSYVRIGKLFGNRDHTTILNTARKMGVARVYE